MQYSNLSRLATGPYTDIHVSPSMVGVGVTPEAIDMVQPAFDIMLESAWRNASFDARTWFQGWTQRRYGAFSPILSAAADTLYQAAYRFEIDTASLENTPGVMDDTSHNTNATGILQAYRGFVSAAVAGQVR